MEVARPRMPLFRRTKAPGESSCEDNLAELAAASAVVSARLPMLRIHSFQTKRSPFLGPTLLIVCPSPDSLHILLATLLFVFDSRRRVSAIAVGDRRCRAQGWAIRKADSRIESERRHCKRLATLIEPCTCLETEERSECGPTRPIHLRFVMVFHAFPARQAIGCKTSFPCQPRCQRSGSLCDRLR